MTVRGRMLIEQADVIVHDYLANPAILAWARPDAERVPVGRPPERLQQSEINQLLVDYGLAGRRVVRLKGGDPFVFGRGGEEAEVLRQAGVRYEVVPGVTAAVSAAAFAGIPVTDRRFASTLAICTGHRKTGQADPLDWPALARMDTLVIYMGARRLPQIAAALMAHGKPPETPVAIVRWATRPSQDTRITRLDRCADAPVQPPATIIVGGVVTLREQVAWFERRPLHGVRVVSTRSARQQGRIEVELGEQGAEVISLPAIRFTDLTATPAVQQAIAGLSGWDWVVFTSANGVDFFMDALQARGLDGRAFGAARLACVGPATARSLAARGLNADLVPERYVAEGLAEALCQTPIVGQRVLIVRAEVGRSVLPDALAAAGAEVDLLPVYRTERATPVQTARDRVAQGEAHVVVFTASSTVRHFRAAFDAEEWARLCPQILAACIGPITARTAAELGMRVAITPTRYTLDGLMQALIAWGAARKG